MSSTQGAPLVREPLAQIGCFFDAYPYGSISHESEGHFFVSSAEPEADIQHYIETFRPNEKGILRLHYVPIGEGENLGSAHFAVSESFGIVQTMGETRDPNFAAEFTLNALKTYMAYDIYRASVQTGAKALRGITDRTILQSPDPYCQTQIDILEKGLGVYARRNTVRADI